MKHYRESELAEAAFAAFAADVTTKPTITLRGGNALDDYQQLPQFEESIDAITDAYLERYAWGIGYLDAASWRHVLPYLMAYALRHISEGSDVVDAFLNSLRPPDRQPPRLASLSAEQEIVVSRFIDVLAFSDESAHHELACQTMEEWWAPSSLYRPSPDGA